MAEYQLLVVAHPDDEAIFFSSLLLQKRELPWKVICVTDGDADGQGGERRQHWVKAMKAFNISDFQHWTFPDIFEERLEIAALQSKISALPRPKMAYTHGILGEYGHPHHQDVSYAMHSVLSDKIPLYSTSYNCHSDFALQLTKTEFALKLSILFDIYGSQFRGFANKLPATEYEGFQRVGIAEVTSIYKFLSLREPLRETALIKYRHLFEHVVQVFGEPLRRPF